MIERLGDVVVGSKLQALHLVHCVITRREHHDRYIGERPDLAEDLIPIDAGEPHVQQHNVRMLPLDNVQGGFALPCPQDIDVAPLQRKTEPNGLDNIGFVVDDKDLHHISSGGPAEGTTRVNVLPWPGRLRTSIVPPCAWAMASALGRPSPTPS